MATMNGNDIKVLKLKKTTSTISMNNKQGLVLYIPSAIRQLLELTKGEKMVFDVKSGNKVMLRRLTKEEENMINETKK